MAKSLLDSYLEIAKDLKEKGELDPENQELLNDLYEKLTDIVCSVIGETDRVEIKSYIRKRFEKELL